MFVSTEGNRKMRTKIKILIPTILIALSLGIGYAVATTYHHNPSPSVTVTFASPTPSPSPTTSPTPIPTALEVHTQLSITLNGNLVTNGATAYATSGVLAFTAALDQPLAGVTVNFMDGAGVVCSGITNSAGIATGTYNGAFALTSHTYTAVPQQ